MDKKRLEIREINAKRWAFLQIPFGVLLALVFLIITLSESEGILASTVYAFLAAPCVVIFTLVQGYLQAWIINMVIYLLDAGPLFIVKERGDEDVMERMENNRKIMKGGLRDS